MAEEGLEKIVAGSPPRFTLLWEREKRSFRKCALSWLEREAANARRSTPAHFEVGFGLGESPEGGEPHDPEPIEIPLGDDRTLRVSGKIDRIDRRDDGLVLRDYKTGRAPKDDGRIFRGGRQLQIPFYVLATERIFPKEKVTEAFLDYVDAGRQVAFDARGGPQRDVPRSPGESRRPDRREASSCRSPPPATGATSGRCAGPRACSSGGSRSRSATRTCSPTCA